MYIKMRLKIMTTYNLNDLNNIQYLYRDGLRLIEDQH